MEKLPKTYEKEYMRMAMLKHEETFKQQVHELHRLYQTQKTMMKNTEKNRQQSGWNNPESWDKRNNNNEICFRQIYEQDAKNYYRTSSTTTHTTKLDLEQPAEEEDETEPNNNNNDQLQLTLGPSSYNYNTSDSGITHSSSSTGSSHEDTNKQVIITGQEMEVNLGLTGNSSGYQNGGNRGGEKMKKKMLEYPPWPFQVVSLNMT